MVPPPRQWLTIAITSSATFVVVSVTSKLNAPYASSSSRKMMGSSRSSVKDNKINHADSTNETLEAGEVPCGAHTARQPPIATPTAAPGGANLLMATSTFCNQACADKENLQRFRSSRRGRSAGMPLHLLHSDEGTSHGGNCSGAKAK